MKLHLHFALNAQRNGQSQPRIRGTSTGHGGYAELDKSPRYQQGLRTHRFMRRVLLLDEKRNDEKMRN